MSARNICFTLLNFTTAEVDSMAHWFETTASYLIYGKEYCPSTMTSHLQGYVEFRNSMRFETIRKYWKGRLHMEERRGTALQASDYCKKDGDFTIFGSISNQGKRSDLNEVGLMLINGVSMDSIARDVPGTFIRFHKGLQALRNCTRFQDRTEAPTAIWNWGKTGTGKTHEPTSLGKSFYIKDGTCWWDGYEGQEVIVIDDFDGHWPFRDFLRLLDKHPYQGQVKGGYVKINSPLIYITCEFPPDEFWQDNTLAQVTRRFTKINHCKARFSEKLAAAEVVGNTSHPSDAKKEEVDLTKTQKIRQQLDFIMSNIPKSPLK